MKVNVSRLKYRPGEIFRLNLTQNFLPFVIGGEEITYTAPVTLDLEEVFDGRVFHFNGKLETVLGLTCDRCLGTFSFPLTTDFNAAFQSTNEGRKEEEVEGEDKQEIETFSGDEVDLTDKVQEHVVLALPMKALCRTDCQGLCPQCGKDLNLEPCQCESDTFDPRLATLERWLNKTRARS